MYTLYTVQPIFIYVKAPKGIYIENVFDHFFFDFKPNYILKVKEYNNIMF